MGRTSPFWITWLSIAFSMVACDQPHERSVEPSDSSRVNEESQGSNSPRERPLPEQNVETEPEQRPEAGPSTATSKTSLVVSDATRESLVARRPYSLFNPKTGEVSETPMPLFVFLHGYGSSSKRLREVLDVESVARERGVLLATPDGTREPIGRRFWNATPACCNFSGSTIDDVQYIAALIDDVARHAPVDTSKVFVVGHSNGGFMAHRLACELSDRVVGIASIAGTPDADESRCHPQYPVTVLQIHGDADTVIAFEGGHALGKASLPRHPSAQATVNRWAALNGCESTPHSKGRLDLEARLPGAETKVWAYSKCRGGVVVELWAVEGGSHFVAQERGALDLVHDFLLSHPRSSGVSQR